MNVADFIGISVPEGVILSWLPRSYKHAFAGGEE
jgi:hypothetical protein